MSSKGKELKISEEVKSAWQRLTQDDNKISWVLFGYDEGNLSDLVLKGEGEGGMPEFKSKLTESEIYWGGFKVLAVDDRGNTVSRRPKYIFVKYFSQSAPSIKRARAGAHKGAIKIIVNPHLDVEVDSADQLTEEDIVARLRACGGAHAPTGYEFSDYSG